MWRQESRTKLLTTADLNTKFFHLSTIVRRRQNAIDFLKNQQGSWVSGREEIGKCFEEFFINLFTSSNPYDPNNLDKLIVPNLSKEGVEMVSSVPTVDEVKDVVFSLGSNKAPRPYGISAHFFKFYWNIFFWGGGVGEVAEAIISFFIRGYMLKEINRSFIALIPKGNNVASVNQFKPFSLCNVLYKIISKLLANRLKKVIYKLVSLWQTAFIPGCKIQENTILAQEILHAMKKKKGKTSWMALKIDMEKTYDRLE